jgi:hypothetical protein
MIRLKRWWCLGLLVCATNSATPVFACSMEYAADGSVTAQIGCDAEYESDSYSQSTEPAYDDESNEEYAAVDDAESYVDSSVDSNTEAEAEDCYSKADSWVQKSYEQDPSGYYDYGEFLDKCLGPSAQ